MVNFLFAKNMYDRKGNHLGSMDPVTGEIYKPAVPGRRLNF